MNPAPGDMTQVGYVMTHYPRNAQTFIAGEIDSVRRAGVGVSCFAMNRPDAAELEASKFVGFDIALEFDPDPVPADIKAAAMFLAQTMTDQMPPEECNIRRARAESLLRPYRRETGIAA